MKSLLRISTVLFTFALLSVQAKAAEPGKISFNQDVRPILSDRCYFCHGPDPAHREADLRLDDREVALEFLAIVPGKPDESELIRRIESHDPDEQMPPPASKRTITAEEIQTLRTWIAQGAEYQQHWSFRRIEKTAVPEIEDSTWPTNEIDHFILQAMKERQLQPNPVAKRETLLRRVTFDLTGLPPTLEELDAFLNDSSPNAYEKVVDRLLASPAYGERMTSEWLDVARYSDTYGYQVDRDRFVWPWRDWVINAFNQNLPYDQFITEQLAGDLLPNPTQDQILATTFNRLHPQKVEGGSVPEEFRIEYVADRTQTFATAFLGLTMECARCHTHKYDPLTQTEYYQISSFFDNIDEAGLYSFFTSAIPTPTLLLTYDQQKQQIADLQKAISEKVAEEEQVKQEAHSRYEEWRVSDHMELIKDQQKLIPDQIAHLDFESGSFGNNTSVPGVHGQAVKLTGDDAINLEVGNFRRFQPFSVSLWMQTPDVKERAVIFHRSRAWTDAASRGYEMLIEEGRLSASLIHFWPGNAISIRTKEPIPTSEWLHVAMTYDGSSRAEGIGLWINGERAETEIVRNELRKNITGGGGDNIAIGERFRDRGFKNGLVDEFKVYQRELTTLEIATQAGEISLGNYLTLINESVKRDAIQDSPLKNYYLSNFDEAYRTHLEELRLLREKLCNLLDPVSEIMVMREREEPRPTYLLNRGDYTQPADEVRDEIPAVLNPFPEGAPRNRLGLAKWLTDRDNPLTARVTVNRYWQMLFSQGLVRTPEDFGSQGMPPTHPELLDWLALDFMTHNWDVKGLLKQIVMSNTYQQSSQVKPEEIKRDPENRWLARFPARRLPAEMLRDNALAVSGLLVKKVGGAPVKPYEVEDSFKPTARSKGEGLYRRSLYTYWKRTAPAPAMMTFDASKRDVCQVKREKTSSPLQAFIMMNGPQFVEAARNLAEESLRLHPEDSTAAITRMFRQLTSRVPSDQEMSVLNNLYQQNRNHFQSNQDAALSYLKIGDKPRDESLEPTSAAALTIVANTLLNYDETMMQR
ncbi:DUF1553 domain-containing protein [Rubinisphaera sp.]|uniref:DUF1553 domain-containing protein n=1 Tax=Rubinisphaera sp. TaxID=2024857 RepID=UPI000C109ADA|nr:DUF1553 domain-containing protein [Rubinisphaera sp.]MBV08554.1 hypothetical protein [Rubinisphaera sp.]HCS50239.1 hypothetical protein [Planctomycetaceae bacterium]